MCVTCQKTQNTKKNLNMGFAQKGRENSRACLYLFFVMFRTLFRPQMSENFFFWLYNLSQLDILSKCAVFWLSFAAKYIKFAGKKGYIWSAVRSENWYQDQFRYGEFKNRGPKSWNSLEESEEEEREEKTKINKIKKKIGKNINFLFKLGTKTAPVSHLWDPSKAEIFLEGQEGYSLLLNVIHLHYNTLLVPFKSIKWSKISFFGEIRY